MRECIECGEFGIASIENLRTQSTHSLPGETWTVQEGMAGMGIAWRVLDAINELRNPDLKDVEELRRLAPVPANQPLDELACLVIRRTIKSRAEVRRDGQGADDRPKAVKL